MQRMRLTAIAVAGLALVGGACSGGDDYSKADFQTDLEEEADMSPELAECMADGLEEAGIDFSDFDSDADPEDIFDEEQQATFTEAATDCAMEDAGIDPEDLEVPTTEG
jgi:hypothetical protein